MAAPVGSERAGENGMASPFESSPVAITNPAVPMLFR
jgi:hypothetical protein